MLNEKDNEQNNNQYWFLSPFVIILTFICCWPVALILLYLKYIKGFKIDKNSDLAIWQRKQKTNQILAIIFLMITLIFVSVTLPDSNESISSRIGDTALFLVLFGLPAFLFFRKATKFKKKVNQTIEYTDLIVIRNITSIQEISNRLGVSQEQVLKFVSEMIRNKQLDGYIKKEQEIILKSANKNMHSIKCTNCGAENIYRENDENICEYCGSLLKL